MNSPSPKVAIFISSMAGGGAERVMRDLANAFVNCKLQVDLVLTRAEGPYLTGLDPRARVVDLAVRRPVLALPKFARYLATTKPTAVLSALDHTNLIAIAARSLSGASVRLVVSQRADPRVRPRVRDKPLELVNYWLLGFGYRRADAVVAVSVGVAEGLEEAHGVPRERLRVIYNPVPSDRPIQEEPPHPWYSSTEAPVILGAGRLTHQKGFDTLLRAFRIVRDQRQSRLIILGEGEDERQLKALAKELGLVGDVLFPGFVDNPRDWMARSAVFVLSSRWEGFGLVLVEAMSCGTPVVSTDCPSGPREILGFGRWGRLTDVDDEREMANAILQTMDDPDPPKVTERASDFAPDIAVREYLDVLGLKDWGLTSESTHPGPAKSSPPVSGSQNLSEHSTDDQS